MDTQKLAEARERIIVALDFPTTGKIEPLVAALNEYHPVFKVGLELISSVGGAVAVSLVHDLGGKVFYDSKLHDIPNTMAGAARAIAGMGVAMFNVHASAGIEAMVAAREAARAEQLKVVHWGDDQPIMGRDGPIMLAVTVLTSLNEENCHLIYGAPSKVKVLQLARDALLAGLEGIICSPQELELLGQQKELAKLLKVTPGVRPEWAAVGDQKRVTTPAQAIRAGATYVVVGRPITNPPKEIGTPLDAFNRIAEEIAAVL